MERANQKCGNCKFWREQMLQKHQGSCCINPPVAVPIPSQGGLGVTGIWPASISTDWCAKWENNPEAPAKVEKQPEKSLIQR